MRIDLNSDLGESYGRWALGDDRAMLELVTSANVACGAHAGDPTVMRRTCAHAAERGVAVGAHVGYRDLAGFGRRRIAVDPGELADDVVVQLGGLAAAARAAGTSVGHVKAHGALYHAMADDPSTAEAVVAGVAAVDPALVLLGQDDPTVRGAAEDGGLRLEVEAFADRAYRPDGRLVPRSEPGAVLDDPAVVAERAVGIARDGTVAAVDGTLLAVRAASLCVHGDSPGAVAMARAVREALDAAGVTVVAFAADEG